MKEAKCGQYDFIFGGGDGLSVHVDYFNDGGASGDGIYSNQEVRLYGGKANLCLHYSPLNPNSLRKMADEMEAYEATLSKTKPKSDEPKKETKPQPDGLKWMEELLTNGKLSEQVDEVLEQAKSFLDSVRDSIKKQVK